MGLQDAIDAISAAGQAQRREYHLTLGELVEVLFDLPDHDIPIEFDDGSTPGRLHSYRGYYQDLAFSTGATGNVGDVLEDAQDAIGETFTGYKGGDFRMDETTPLWRAESGETGDAIVGLDVQDDRVVLETQEVSP